MLTSFSWWSLESRVIWSLIHMLDLGRPLGRVSLCSGDQERKFPNGETLQGWADTLVEGKELGEQGRGGILGGKNPQGDEGNSVEVGLSLWWLW